LSDKTGRVLKRSQVLVRRWPRVPIEVPDAAGVHEEAGGSDPVSRVTEAQPDPPPQVREVQVDLEAERRAAWQEGFEEGYRQAQSDLQPLVSSLKEATRSLADEREDLIRGAELVVVRLAYEIARKVVGHEVQMSTDAIVYTVREALRRIADRDRIVLRLNPQDVRTIRSNRYLQRDLFETFAEVDIREDEEVARGGCIVETSSGLIDATIETQLAEIEAALFGEET